MIKAFSASIKPKSTIVRNSVTTPNVLRHCLEKRVLNLIKPLFTTINTHVDLVRVLFHTPKRLQPVKWMNIANYRGDPRPSSTGGCGFQICLTLDVLVNTHLAPGHDLLQIYLMRMFRHAVETYIPMVYLFGE